MAPGAMVARTLLVVALAATLLIGGVAATGAASVQDAQPDDQDDRSPGEAGPPDDSTQYEGGADAGNGTAADRGNGTVAERGNGSAPADVGPDSERGPPTDMPANVPDHVTQIHQTINTFLSGDVDNLGNALSEFLGGDDAGEEAENESGEAEDADESEEDVADDETEDDDGEDDADADDEESEDADDDPRDADDDSEDAADA